MRRAALFDMDGTLLATSTALLYTRYRKDLGEIGWLGMLRVARWMLEYSLGVIDAEKVAQKALAEFKGREVSWITSRIDDWFPRYVLGHVRDLARSTVERHRSEGHVLAIVTGATPYAAEPLARELGIEHVVSSELEIDAGGRLTGLPVSPLCYGHGKVTRAEVLARRLDVRLEEATFYSDSITDLPLLERVATPVAVSPDKRLLRVATRRGWRVEWW